MEIGKKSKFFEGSDEEDDLDPHLETSIEFDDVEFDNKEIEEELTNWNRSVYKASRKMKQDPSRNFFNRLKSIEKDKLFLDKVISKASPKFPLIGNLRCGLWYFPKYDHTCYFKSTDGHVGKWQFNLSRVNMNVVQLIVENGGCFIVDSTRKGKKFPDSFSRTIPIWSATINKTASILKEDSSFFSFLSMPSWISESERSQVDKLIPAFSQKLLTSGADLTILKEKLTKPLQVYWIHPSSSSSLNSFFQTIREEKKEVYPVILISVSEEETSVEGEGYSYVQGAGDDEESWANGLSPFLFWKNSNYLLESGYTDIMKRLDRILEKNSEENSKDIHVSQYSSDQFHFIKIGETGLFIGSSLDGLAESSSLFGGIINCSERTYIGISSKYLHIPVPEGKSDKNKIGKILSASLSFIHENLEKKVLIHSASGLNAPVCIAIATLIKYFNLETFQLLEKPRINVSKNEIRKASLVIEKYCPQSRPPKVMMNELNRYFITPVHLQPKAVRESSTK